jgi:TatD DNase family protein
MLHKQPHKQGGSTMRLFDSHCHLFMEPLGDAPGEAVERARSAGVERMLVPAVDIASWDVIRELTDLPGVFAAYGLHPWDAAIGLDVNNLRDTLTGAGGIAIGEIGLDSKADGSPMILQEQVFIAQLELALEMDLPVLLHCRGAFDEMLSILGDPPFAGRIRGVVHAFSKGPELARRYLDLGLLLAFGGAVTRPGARKAHESAAFVPADLFLLETDAPSIGLEGVEPGEAEPAHVAMVAAAMASIRKKPVEEVAEVSWRNTCRLLGLGADE